MADSWRAGLGGTVAEQKNIPVVAIQLPGYDGDCKTLVRTNGPQWDFCNQLLNMRLSQEAGFASDPKGAAVVSEPQTPITSPAVGKSRTLDGEP